MATPAKTEMKTAKNVIVKATNAEERTITAVVSSSNYDRDYERVDVPTLRLPLKGGGHVKAADLDGTEKIDIPMLLNHSFDVEDVIGSVRKAYLNELGELVVEFGISSRAKAQDLLMLIDEGHLDNAFSITMSDYMYDDDTISNAEIVEISMVFRGSNKDARVLAVKSLLKGESDMSKDLAAKKAELEKLSKEIADAEAAAADDEKTSLNDDTEVVAPEKQDDHKTDEEKAQDEAAEKQAEENAKTPEDEVRSAGNPEGTEVVGVEDEQNNDDKEEEDMSDASKSIATKTITKKPAEAEQEVIVKTKVDKKAIRELYVKQLKAHLAGDKAELGKLNEKAAELMGVKSKEITFADGSAVMQSEVVSSDIREAYTNLGRVGSIVNRINVDGVEKWSQLNETKGAGFQPVGAEEQKPEDKPVWTKLSIEPKEHAMIVAWFDGMAKRTPLAVYEQITRYIAKMYADLEDKIVLTFAGVTTTGGDVFAATGLVPILSADETRQVEMADYSGAAVQAALGAAYGLVESDETITIAANRKSWAKLATAVDAQGRNVFTVVGDQVTAGALGTFNVVLSQKLDDDTLVIGAFGDYNLVTNGGLETLFSREATVGDLNLYVSDASALRANVDIAGRPVSLNSFALVTLAAQV